MKWEENLIENDEFGTRTNAMMLFNFEVKRMNEFYFNKGVLRKLCNIAIGKRQPNELATILIGNDK